MIHEYVPFCIIINNKWWTFIMDVVKNFKKETIGKYIILKDFLLVVTPRNSQVSNN